jgi:hypothetical protein
MHDAARIGYAQARVQARLGDRPSEPFWRELEAGREFPHLVDRVRASALAEAVSALAGDVGVHALEARLRHHWAEACEEVASWYPASSHEAMRWLQWLPLLPALAWLAQDKPSQPWMDEDPVLGPIAAATDPEERAARLGESGLAPLAPAFASGDDLASAWHRLWRDRWPAIDTRALRRLDQSIGCLLPGVGGGAGPAFDALVDAAATDTLRLFRRHVCSPVAGVCGLVLGWLGHLRLRAALVGARLFGAAEAA